MQGKNFVDVGSFLVRREFLWLKSIMKSPIRFYRARAVTIGFIMAANGTIIGTMAAQTSQSTRLQAMITLKMLVQMSA